MAARKAQVRRQFSDGKTHYVREPREYKEPQDPGIKDESQPITKKIPAFLADSFAKPGWNR